MNADEENSIERVEEQVLSLLRQSTSPQPVREIVNALSVASKGLGFEPVRVKLAALNLVSDGRVRMNGDWRLLIR